MDRYLGCKFIFGGDFNVTRPSNAVIYHTIDKFCVANRLEWLDPVHWPHLLVTLFSRCSQSHLVIISACVYASVKGENGH